MTTKQQTPALISRSVASSIGAQAYSAAVARLDDEHAIYALEAVKAAQAGIDVLARQAVALAREQGKTWQEIGAALGVTKQAAQQRYGR